MLILFQCLWFCAKLKQQKTADLIDTEGFCHSGLLICKNGSGGVISLNDNWNRVWETGQSDTSTVITPRSSYVKNVSLTCIVKMGCAL